jgi:hypothetical protein
MSEELDMAVDLVYNIRHPDYHPKVSYLEYSPYYQLGRIWHPENHIKVNYLINVKKMAPRLPSPG